MRTKVRLSILRSILVSLQGKQGKLYAAYNTISSKLIMSGMGNGRHLVTGDAEPAPPAKDVLRVYGMKFCPFVHRLKLVLVAKGIDHETVNCNLKTKPEWLFVKNPRGKVPVIEKNGEILYESDITSDFVDAAYEGKRKVTTQDPMRLAKERMLLGDLDTFVVSSFYAAGRADSDEARAEHLTKLNTGLASLVAFLAAVHQPFIGGDRPGMSDYMFWPFLERIHLVVPDVIAANDVIAAYCARMGEDEAVKRCRHSDEVHGQFMASHRAGNSTYDIGDVDDRAVVFCKC